MTIDAQIPLMVRPPSDPMEGMGRAMSLAALAQQGRLQQVQLEQAQRDQEATRSIADMYRGAIGADGKVDRVKLTQSLASGGFGDKIAPLQKTWLETDKAQAELDNQRGQIDERTHKMLTARIQAANGAIASLLQRPSITPDDVMGTLNGMVSQGLLKPEEGAAAARQMPSDPGQLRAWVQQKALEGVEAGKRLELLTPKPVERGDGQKKWYEDSNPWTNPGGMSTVQMQLTPGEVQQAKDAAAGRSVTIRGQNMVDARARESAAQGKWQYDGKRGGLVNVQTGEFKPATQNGVPLTPETDKPTEDQAKAAGWLVQADNAWKNMQKAMDADPSVITPSWLPAGSKAANLVQGPQRQMFNQGASSFSEALLRAATGAGVNAYEAQQKVAELTPQIGDSPDVVKQKLDAIPIYLESLKVRAGPAGKQAMDAVSKLPQRQAAPAAPKVGTVDSGYLYTGGDPADPKSWKKVGK